MSESRTIRQFGLKGAVQLLFLIERKSRLFVVELLTETIPDERGEETGVLAKHPR